MPRNKTTGNQLAADIRAPELEEVTRNASPERSSDSTFEVGPAMFSLSAPGPDEIAAANRTWSLARPTKILDTLWHFAVERQRIYFTRLRGKQPPWTQDPVLKSYRFTNVFRATDRVSQFLISRVIRTDQLSAEDVFFRVILFKIFNRIETWELFEQRVGPPSWRAYRFEKYERVLDEAFASGTSIYSPAYITPPPPGSTGKRKHSNHLHLIESMMIQGLPAQLGRARSMQEVFNLLRSFSGVGEFLAYQFAIDLNYSDLIDFSESDFVVPGPGAREGLEKCFTHFGGISETDMIRLMQERQAEEFARLGIPKVTLWGREIQLIDCQNLLCEVAKYSRVAHPEVSSRNGRSRIKQRFEPRNRPLPRPTFPAKWALEPALKQWLEQNASV